MSDITIVIPALNEEKYLPNLLQSLAEQTDTDFDVVVVDGSSQDNTVQVARSFGSKLAGLKVITSPKASAPLQRNLGARASRREWLLFLDADSRVPRYCVARLQQFIRDQRPEFFTAWSLADGETPRDAILSLIVDLYIECSVLAHRAVAVGSMFAVRRDLFERLGGFDETITMAEDYDLTQRILAAGVPLHILRETLYLYSLRRARKEGLMRFFWTYARISLQALITGQSPRHLSSYVLGGQYFDKTPTAAHEAAPAIRPQAVKP